MNTELTGLLQSF